MLGLQHLRSKISTLWGAELPTHSLQWRLTLEVAALFILGLGGVGLWSGWKMQQLLISSQIQAVTYIAKRFPEDVDAYSKMLPLPQGLERTIQQVTVPGLVVWVKDRQGNLLAQSPELGRESATSHALMTIANMPLGPEVYSVGNRYFVLCTTPLSLSTVSLGKVYLAQDVTAEQQQLQSALTSLSAVTLLATLLIMAVLATRIRLALRPLAELSQIAEGLDPENLSPAQLSFKRAPSEVEALTRAFKLMLDRLGDAWERQRQFVSNVSHELRTPLTIMLGYVQMVLRRGSNLNEDQREALETAVAEAHRTVQLLQDLLDLARADSGHQQLQIQPLVLNELVQEVVATLEGCQQRSIVVRATGVVTAQADRERLRQVLINLVENAIRYSGAQQPIHIDLSHIDLGERGQQVLMQVQDYGIGIPLADQERIFERFYRVDEARSRSTGGTGLGLAIARTFVEAMGGTISVQSQPGQGSTFTIVLMPV